MLDPTIVRQQIENLRLCFPDLEADDEAWLLALESETELDELLAKIVDRLDDVAALQGGLEGKIAEFKIRSDRFGAQQLKLRETALALMQAAGVQKKELPSATLSVRKGGEKVVIPDDSAVPDEFCKFTRTPNKTDIKELLQNGGKPTWAAIVQGDPTLTVRSK